MVLLSSLSHADTFNQTFTCTERCQNKQDLLSEHPLTSIWVLSVLRLSVKKFTFKCLKRTEVTG